jgi:hypothetical protein
MTTHTREQQETLAMAFVQRHKIPISDLGLVDMQDVYPALPRDFAAKTSVDKFCRAWYDKRTQIHRELKDAFGFDCEAVQAKVRGKYSLKRSTHILSIPLFLQYLNL